MHAPKCVEMENKKTYNVRFAGLKEGKHHFDYHVDNQFFIDRFQYKEFNNAQVDVHLLLHKKSTMLELFFTVEGTVNVNCDVTNIPYDQPLQGKLELVVKCSDFEEEENEEILVLPHGTNELNVGHYIYEAVVLAVPYKKVHPKVIDGTMDSPILDKLEELSPGYPSENEETDPRWDQLKELLNKK